MAGGAELGFRVVCGAGFRIDMCQLRGLGIPNHKTNAGILLCCQCMFLTEVSLVSPSYGSEFSGFFVQCSRIWGFGLRLLPYGSQGLRSLGLRLLSYGSQNLRKTIAQVSHWGNRRTLEIRTGFWASL